MAAAKKQATISKKQKTTFSITFCECGENDSNGMEKIGKKALTVAKSTADRREL